MDLSILSIGDLQKLRTRVEKEIAGRSKKQRGRALVEIKAIVAKYGLKLEELMEGPGSHDVSKMASKAPAKAGRKTLAKSAKKSGTVLFQHPENPNLTWGGGRGRRPQWIKDWELSGRSLDEVRLAKQ